MEHAYSPAGKQSRIRDGRPFPFSQLSKAEGELTSTCQEPLLTFPDEAQSLLYAAPKRVGSSAE
jgi:hypothetical protein